MRDEDTPSNLLVRLRSETRSEHDAVEAALDLGGLTRERYDHFLKRFFGFYRPIEDAIGSVGGWADRGLDLERRRKAPLLEADLRALGVDAPDRLPVCPDPPRLDTPAACFGCLYVLEGATLGGQVISRHISGTLGIGSETGGRFFHGYGERTGEMWRSFGTALVAFAATREIEDRVVAAARETFRALRSWCQRSPAV
ncbi:bacteriophytochrome heme oxygenase BphO [Frigoriglobus tundricola]|uniref:Bacteriophytochrome heme oxygenase BphO n=2 Tax=Frigoriglobus tundricola TaxID=2774151 RepID=A0A6M5YJ14_9BACT|nr:bacteriophytochrome heme oxygenase BphO [Frigoriglobus tundricola]